MAGGSVTLSQYADDTTIFLRDVVALRAALQSIHEFSTWSGLRINHHKSHLLLLGNHLHPPTSFHGIQVVDTVKILGIHFRANMTQEDNYRLNFLPNLKKIRNICTSWSNRSISIKGKVTLITSLMISLLQYQCTAVSTPPKVYSEFKNIVTDFTWNGKRSKVAYNVLIQEIVCGGLKLPDLQTRVQVIHLKWIRYMWDNQNSPLTRIFVVSCHSHDAKMLLQCKTKFVHKLDERYTFLYEILSTWARVHIFQPASVEDVLEQVLWHNDYITVNKASLCWRAWNRAGIVYVNDLLHPSLPRLLSHEEIVQRYGVTCSFLDALQIRSSLPGHWRTLIQISAQSSITPRLQIRISNRAPVDINNISPRRLYGMLIVNKTQAVAAQAKWNLEFAPPQDVPQGKYWEPIYRSPYCSLRETKLQSFQFKLLHRILPCKKYLMNIRIANSDLCDFCEVTDTLSHFFFYCQKVTVFWAALCNWFSQQTDLRLDQVTCQEFLFGLPKEAACSKITNVILLNAKFYIYRQKLYHMSLLDITAFLKEFRYKLKMEEHVCHLEGKANKFRPWKGIVNALG